MADENTSFHLMTAIDTQSDSEAFNALTTHGLLATIPVIEEWGSLGVWVCGSSKIVRRFRFPHVYKHPSFDTGSYLKWPRNPGTDCAPMNLHQLRYRLIKE